jgi:uncharacterized membrane protein YccC
MNVGKRVRLTVVGYLIGAVISFFILSDLVSGTLFLVLVLLTLILAELIDIRTAGQGDS